MILSPFPFRRSIFLLALLSFGFLVSVCTAQSTEGVDVQPLMGKEAREFLPYGNTLAVSSSMRSFTLTMNNAGLVPADRGGSWDEFGNALTDGTSDLTIADGDLTEWYVWVSS